jgi:hypothetical protein
MFLGFDFSISLSFRFLAAELSFSHASKKEGDDRWSSSAFIAGGTLHLIIESMIDKNHAVASRVPKHEKKLVRRRG